MILILPGALLRQMKGRLEESQYVPSSSARLTDRVRDQQQCVARRRHDELLTRDVRRNGACDVCMGMGRRHDQHEVGAGDRGGGIVGDERKRREALAQNSLVCDAADGATTASVVPALRP